MSEQSAYYIPATEAQLEIINNHFSLTPQDLEAQIESLQKYIKSRPNLVKITSHNVLAQIVLRSNNCLEQAQKILDMYFTSDNLYPEILQRRDPKSSDIQNFVQSSQFYLFSPKLTPEGNIVLIIGGISDLSVETKLKWQSLALDITLMTAPLFKKVIVIYDMKGHRVSIPHQIDLTRRTASYFRILHKHSTEKIYILDFDKKYYTPAFAFLNMFFKKAFNRIEFWDKPSHELKNVVDKDSLPFEYGGTLGPRNEIKERFYRYAYNFRDQCLSGNLSGVADIYLKGSQLANESIPDTDFGINGTFRTIELD